MNQRMFLAIVLWALFGVCSAAMFLGSTAAQGQPSELINDAQKNASAAALRARHGAATLGAARNFYKRLRIAQERDPDSISAKDVSRASLEWFKAEIALVQSKSEATEIVSAYLERE